MLRQRIAEHPVHGKCLYVDNGVLELGIPLTFGIRITHLSFVGEENVFFVQPREMTDFSLPSGWRVYGGHRLWLAPESPDNYYPENAPIEYAVKGNTVSLTQQNDPLLAVVKSISITLKGNRVTVMHRILNTANQRKRVALWGVSSMKAGGVITVPLKVREDGYDPNLHISAWDYTNLSDDRLLFSREQIQMVQRESDRKCKIGVGHPSGPVTYENGNTVFTKIIPFYAGKTYTDGGVSFEGFLSNHMVEVEGLSPLKSVAPGKTASYKEIWELSRKN